jgi:hypothetical protein
MPAVRDENFPKASRIATLTGGAALRCRRAYPQVSPAWFMATGSVTTSIKTPKSLAQIPRRPPDREFNFINTSQGFHIPLV